jgi:hypothetical protein
LTHLDTVRLEIMTHTGRYRATLVGPTFISANIPKRKSIITTHTRRQLEELILLQQRAVSNSPAEQEDSLYLDARELRNE